MERVQFYTESQLKEVLDKEAREKGVSISALVTEILQDHYNLTPKNAMPLSDVMPKILDEVQDHVKQLNVGDQFDLLTASETFANIAMTAAGKPSANRATVGRIFGAKIGKEPFENVSRAYKDDGITRAKSPNNALMYQKD